jgi:hypothetical protein
MSSQAAQVAVALVENQGNLSKTLSAPESSSSVKSLATSMVIGGTLAGFPIKQDCRLWSKMKGALPPGTHTHPSPGHS